ncbi:MAG TPA: DUF1464 family protein [Gemmatimonadales bacterium]|nr:DUF1464 family protein [Gemmatimonadales bacterium]
MPRVAGVDPGTISIDVCGLEDGELYLDRTIPTAAALADPAGFVSLLRGARPPDLIAGPSGYGLPLVPAASATEEDLRLAFLTAPGEEGGIGGLRRLARMLGSSGLPVVYTPGVIHLDTVPAHRKLNRVDLGTADKVALAALAIADQCDRLGGPPAEASFLLLELGGAFTAALAVCGGRVVDGLGGSSGAMGLRSSGGWDGEVAYLAGTVTKDHLFQGGAAFLSGDAAPALAESALKAVHALRVSVPAPREILLSGRGLAEPGVEPLLRDGLAGLAPVRRLEGFARVAKTAAQGAAILADGLAGGRWSGLVETMRIREAAGTALDHLVVISPAEARRRLGLG